jgi:hypothetical protein
VGTNGPTPYSSDLAPSDYYLFLHLKKFLGGKRFDDNNDLKDAVTGCSTEVTNIAVDHIL